jgi:hypothetical protein
MLREDVLGRDGNGLAAQFLSALAELFRRVLPYVRLELGFLYTDFDEIWC